MSEQSRFAYLEVDDAPNLGKVADLMAREADEGLMPVATPEPEVIRGVTVDKEGATRSIEDEAAAIAAGFTPAPPLFTVGTMVVDAGVENFKQSRLEFDALPHVAEACDQLIEQVKGEERRDQKVKVPTLEYSADGNLLGGESCVSELPYEGLPMSERAFEGLCNLVTPGAGGYLRNCGMVGDENDLGMKLRAANLTHWFPRAVKLNKRATKKAIKEWAAGNHALFQAGQAPLPKPATCTVKADQEVKLRVRKHPSGVGEEIFSVVGPRYSAFDVDSIAEAIKEHAASMGARCQVLYNGYKAQFDIMFHSNVQPEKAVAGEFFKAGIRLTTADDGTGAIKVQSLVWRNLCLNFIIIDVASQLAMKRRHIGANIAEALDTGMADALRRVEYFAKKWDEASLENVLERYGITEPQTVFERLVVNKVIDIPGYSNDEMVSRLMTAYLTEPGVGKTSYINAITKAAHMHGWASMDQAALLEETGGALLFAKVWDLAEQATTEAALLGW